MNRNTIKKIIASGLIIVTTVVFAEIKEGRNNKKEDTNE